MLMPASRREATWQPRVRLIVIDLAVALIIVIDVAYITTIMITDLLTIAIILFTLLFV